jgi:hypothetical protein
MVLVDSDRISHVPPYSGYWYFKQHFVYEAITLNAKISNLFHYTTLQIFQSYNPKIAETILVWAISTSLAATTEITIVFFSCAYLDVSVQRVRLLSDDMSSTCRVSPFRNLRIKRYLPLLVAYRSLSRLSSPLRA